MKCSKTLSLAVLALALTAAGCSKTEEPKGSAPAPTLSGIAVQTIQPRNVADLNETVGTVRARTSSQLLARIAGTITTVHVKEGDRVAKGKLLLRIEAAEQSAGAAAAQAGVEEARRGLDEARAQQKLAKADFGRFSKLFAEQAATRQELDMRQTSRDVAQQAVARAEARLRQASESARAAGTIAGYGQVTSPMAGVVTAKNVDAGMTVLPGMPLLTVEAENGYRLEATVPESAIATVKIGQRVAIAVDGAAVQGEGTVAEIVPAADPATRTFTVKIDVSGKGLKSGMFGRAFFPTATRQALVIPAGAVVEHGALTSVWVVDKDRTARLRLVKLGRQANATVEVLSGLTAGETIVTGDTAKVTDGAKIQ